MKEDQEDASESDYGDSEPDRRSQKRCDSVENDECDDEYSDGKETPQLTQKTKRGNRKQKCEKKEENSNSKRFLLFLMLSPTLMYFLSIVSEMFPKAKESLLSLTGNTNHIFALIVGAGAVILLCNYCKPLLKYLAVPCLLLFFVPSIQVYRCSPINLSNSDVGTLFRLNANAKKLLEDAYTESSCQRSQPFKTPFKLSLYNPNIRLWVKPYQIINLNMYHQGSRTVPNRGPDAGDEIPADQLPYKLYLFVSQRSVKKQIYYLSLLVLTPSKMTLIDEILKMNVNEKQNVTFLVTGKIENLGNEFIATKKDLQKQNYLIRPLIFRAKHADVIGLPEDEESPEMEGHSTGESTSGDSK